MSLARIPPTLAPSTARALAGGLKAWLTPRSAEGVLERELAALFPGAGALAFNTGRAALAAAIRVAMRATGRDRVVLPAYTSYSVAAAASASGARVVLCDLDPDTLQLDRTSLRASVNGRTAAVVLGNLFGLPDATSDLDFVRAAGALVIDDAAQALGARERGQVVGARGPLGILSFGRGKCVSLGNGGVLLINDPALRQEAGREAPPPDGRGTGVFATAAGTTLSASPLVFGLLSRLPGLRIGESWYDPQFDSTDMPAAARGLAVGLAEVTVQRRLVRERVAREWLAAIPKGSGLRHPEPPEGVEAAWLRVPFLAPDAEDREVRVSRLAQAGLNFVRSFPTPLGAIEGFRPRLLEEQATPGASRIAERLIALPCHGALTTERIQRAATALGTTGTERLAPVLAKTRSTHG